MWSCWITCDLDVFMWDVLGPSLHSSKRLSNWVPTGPKHVPPQGSVVSCVRLFQPCNACACMVSATPFGSRVGTGSEVLLLLHFSIGRKYPDVPVILEVEICSQMVGVQISQLGFFFGFRRLQIDAEVLRFLRLYVCIGLGPAYAPLSSGKNGRQHQNKQQFQHKNITVPSIVQG